jgi:hypothetical protein
MVRWLHRPWGRSAATLYVRQSAAGPGLERGSKGNWPAGLSVLLGSPHASVQLTAEWPVSFSTRHLLLTVTSMHGGFPHPPQGLYSPDSPALYAAAQSTMSWPICWAAGLSMDFHHSWPSLSSLQAGCIHPWCMLTTLSFWRGGQHLPHCCLLPTIGT